MVNKARATSFDIPTSVFTTIGNNTVANVVSLAARENALNPRYLFEMSSGGEYALYDKDGSLIYGVLGPIAGHAAPSDISISSSRLALIVSGTSLCLLNNDGSPRWNFTGGGAIANLRGAKVGTLYVCCFINTGAIATSGVQWRRLSDGAVVQAVYGVGGAAIAVNSGAIAAGETGERASIMYTSIASNFRVENHHINLGRLWSTPDITTGADPTVQKISCDRSCGYIVASAHRFAEGVNNTAWSFVFDNVGQQLNAATFSLASFYFGNCMSPSGRQFGVFYEATIYRGSTVPYNVPTTVLPAGCRGLDITDDGLYYVASCADGNIYVYRADGNLMGTLAYGAATTPIAAVRNWT